MKVCEMCTNAKADARYRTGGAPAICNACFEGLIRRSGAQKSSEQAIALLINLEVEKMSEVGVLEAGEASFGAATGVGQLPARGRGHGRRGGLPHGYGGLAAMGRASGSARTPRRVTFQEPGPPAPPPRQPTWEGAAGRLPVQQEEAGGRLGRLQREWALVATKQRARVVGHDDPGTLQRFQARARHMTSFEQVETCSVR
jgi:hypothetical protein